MQKSTAFSLSLSTGGD